MYEVPLHPLDPSLATSQRVSADENGGIADKEPRGMERTFKRQANDYRPI